MTKCDHVDYCQSCRDKMTLLIRGLIESETGDAFKILTQERDHLRTRVAELEAFEKRILSGAEFWRKKLEAHVGRGRMAEFYREATAIDAARAEGGG